MSLTSFVVRPEVSAKIKPLRPNISRKIVVSLRVEPRSNRYMLIGAAFDYLLRFELQRRAPNAISRNWVAESAPEIIQQQAERAAEGGGVFLESDIPLKEVAERSRRIISESREAVANYIISDGTDREKQEYLAACAIRLARLDLIYRALRLDPHFDEADINDIQDLLDLISIVPFDELINQESMFLNPTFKESSTIVGGADTDLITGDLLVDFKTTKKCEMQASNLDQLLGYFLLARNQRNMDKSYPPINRLGLYYSRHGHLWSMESTEWTNHPQFQEIEKWFIERAKEINSSLINSKKTESIN
jgi:hypothetical protein